MKCKKSYPQKLYAQMINLLQMMYSAPLLYHHLLNQIIFLMVSESGSIMKEDWSEQLYYFLNE